MDEKYQCLEEENANLKIYFIKENNKFEWHLKEADKKTSTIIGSQSKPGNRS